MNSHSDNVKENKSRASANSLPKRQNAGEPTFQFEDNRPETIAQRKLQAIANNSPQVKQLKVLKEIANKNPQTGQPDQLQANGSVVQRYLDIKGAGIFNQRNAANFKLRYSEAERNNMLKNIRDVGGNRYDTIESVLESPDVCMIYYEAEEEEYYAEFVENERTAVTGSLGQRIGATRHVLGHASYAARPATGFEELQMSGLHNCIAVAVETRDRAGVNGIAVSHFNTPSGIDSETKTLTDNGRLALNGFGLLVPGGKAHILWNDHSPEEQDTEAYTSGQRAANLAAFYLHSLGIQTLDIDPLAGDSCRYRLNHDGTAGWH